MIAESPRRATSDTGRRRTYGAALQQFDELLTAATAAGHASRPLPLFYALSQAGRAIAAAYGSSGSITAHGLSEDRSAMSADPLLRKVRRSRATSDALTVVCAALNCPDPFGSSVTAIETRGGLGGTARARRVPPGMEASLATRPSRVQYRRRFMRVGAIGRWRSG